MDRLMLKPSEVAELTGWGRSKTYDLIAAGVIPAVKTGRSIRVPLAALRQWIESNTTGIEPHTTATALDDTKVSR